MCGRFTLTWEERERLAEALGVDPKDITADYKRRFNIAPTDPHWIVRMRHEERQALPAKWGLVNTWSKDAKNAARQINARAESIATTAAFRDAFASRRCVVPADGYFEWTGSGASRQPVWFHRPERQLILFAGLYESWRVTPDQWQRTFTIITTRPNALTAPIHDRMPVILDGEAADRWLDPREDDFEALKALLAPAPEGLLLAQTVSQRVNSVRNDDPACLEPAETTIRLL